MIIDTQIHLWEENRPDRPWSPGAKPMVTPAFGPERMLPLMDEAGVDRAIIVPPSLMGLDNRFALECAARWPDRFSVLALVDVLRPDIADVMARWLKQPGVVGTRVRLLPADRSHWPHPRAADPFFAACERYQAPVAAFAANAVAEAEDVAERFPDLPMILDHLGLPPIDQGFDFPDLPRALGFARFPNVTVKLSTMASRSREPYPYRDIHGMIRRVYDAFGPDRLMWGTDHTQQLARNRATYREQLDLFREALDFLSDYDKAAILGGTAARVFGLPHAASRPVHG